MATPAWFKKGFFRAFIKDTSNIVVSIFVIGLSALVCLHIDEVEDDVVMYGAICFFIGIGIFNLVLGYTLYKEPKE